MNRKCPQFFRIILDLLYFLADIERAWDFQWAHTEFGVCIKSTKTRDIHWYFWNIWQSFGKLGIYCPFIPSLYIKYTRTSSSFGINYKLSCYPGIWKHYSPWYFRVKFFWSNSEMKNSQIIVFWSINEEINLKENYLLSRTDKAVSIRRNLNCNCLSKPQPPIEIDIAYDLVIHNGCTILEMITFSIQYSHKNNSYLDILLGLCVNKSNDLLFVFMISSKSKYWRWRNLMG